jgi:hypothetical protein
MAGRRALAEGGTRHAVGRRVETMRLLRRRVTPAGALDGAVAATARPAADGDHGSDALAADARGRRRRVEHRAARRRAFALASGGAGAVHVSAARRVCTRLWHRGGLRGYT